MEVTQTHTRTDGRTEKHPGRFHLMPRFGALGASVFAINVEHKAAVNG